MGILDNFERGLERAVNGAFARTFRSGLQPVEIAAALKRELDINAVVVDRDRILAPNSFTVRMSATDYTRMSALGAALSDELMQIVHKHAKRQRYQFAGGLTITLAPDPKLTDGVLEVDAATLKGTVSWTPVIDIGGTRYTLTGSRTVIGRGSDVDITINDTGTSRKHVEILWDGRRAKVRDLGSTNGSKLNGHPFREATLEPDSEISIGQTRIIYRVLPQAAALKPKVDNRVSDNTTVQPRVDQDFWRDL
ncbi:DUF3662 and FHA domain-containing protein [Klugiella xanthotipulae]|uniref:Type III secretion system (T3SS) inner membrane Yop/YscD-like protein n=1 Tax=Klugiella xanthotipulae TaxID=244735 RepID=A0A543I6Y3_9MICO|nr:DUF3662 and FHA domain-containing protein [Klugiella xanthotipulae]TQM66337.1 type III secretion system (T3SS) inner membrane Yop/YscD-like protein [Klugiella xanthotipulae]